MARIRTIKPEFFVSEQVAECSVSARLLFVGLWCFCDDGGTHPVSLKRLKMEVFPGDAMTDAEVECLVNELIANGLLVEFQSENSRFWHVPTWKKHQKIEKPTYRYPSPDRPDSASNRRGVDEPSPNPPRRLDPGMESNGVESNGVESNRIKTTSSPSLAAKQLGSDSTGQPATWAEAAEAMKGLKISRRQASIEAAQANHFSAPAVLALIEYLQTVPADKCASPAGALFDRLKTPDAADWLVNENWPWSKTETVEASPYEPSATAAEASAKRLEDERLERTRQFVKELDRLQFAYGQTLDAMSELELSDLITTASTGTRNLLQSEFRAKGRDSPDVRPSLLRLLELKTTKGTEATQREQEGDSRRRQSA